MVMMMIKAQYTHYPCARAVFMGRKRVSKMTPVSTAVNTGVMAVL